ncbi:hypothetical protein NEOLEDRAFT_162928 [Neolentinus lepideus HHB14362 ss-1]|uniref:Arrestin-like N-terminal domain-containing protein n=1 Tax=Neolentinus lepideus HHB14362 ss-1 TaxID=1314782 RepID=A0A165TUM1_9AGAM|nr:hypothetical protein NEOLEDRAFT_162928 [Neolentinus lepideus HHB14362 ss-1]
MAHSRPEPMNASPHHSKVKVSLTMSDPFYIAGGAITGKMEVECRADKGLGLGVMMVELFAIEELTSRDHSATSTFIRSKRLFQGHGLPPSNAVLPHPLPGEPPLPAHYHQARKGMTTYLFKFPLPPSTPSSISFGSGLATLRYEVRASVGVAWKGERRLVTDKKDVDVVEAFDGDSEGITPEAVVVGEGGKIWAQGRVVGRVIVAGQGACIELQVKNHSIKKNAGLSVTLTRHLHLPNLPANEKSPLQISDTLTHVSFKGPEYIAQPGTEGVATLVFDVPKDARSLKGGYREDGEAEGRTTDPLFEVRAVIGVRISMGIGSKDIYLELPVNIVHPNALPPEPLLDPYASPPFAPYVVPDPLSPPMSTTPYLERAQSPYAYPALPMSPTPPVWYPPHPSQTPIPYQYMPMSPVVDPQQQYFYPPVPMFPPIVAAIPPRPSSAEPVHSQPLYNLPSGLPSTGVTQPPPLLPLSLLPLSGVPVGTEEHVDANIDGEEGKGERASRISRHLRLSSRHRSVSPQAHRYPAPLAVSAHIAIPSSSVSQDVNADHLSPTRLSTSPGEILSPRPLPSPKHTVTIDPFTHLSLSKSERVDLLEKMAAEAEKQNKDMSADIPRDIGIVTEVDKTLPGPPVPSGKERVLSAIAASRPRADEVFAVLSSTAPRVDEAPPAPTLHAISPGKSYKLVQPIQPSGLDMLEQKLLEQVGTRKPKEEEKRADVRSILPIAIPPRQSDGLDPVNDSAISSLTLTGFGGDSEEPTYRAQPLSEKTSRELGDRKTSRELGDRKTSRELRDGVGRDHEHSNRGLKERTGDKERRSGKKKEKSGKDVDVYKLRKAAKGRVAEWLGRIDPDVPPLNDTPPPSTPTPDLVPPADWRPASAKVSPVLSAASTLSDKAEVVAAEEPPIEQKRVKPAQKADSPNGEESDTTQKNVNASPNPRSSGFIPVATYRASKLRAQGIVAVAADQARAAVPRSRAKSPVDDIAAELRRSAGMSPKLPKNWPPPSDPEVKYDVRSARGGRGGKVTAITQLWTTQVTGAEAKAPAKPDIPKPKRIVSPLATSVPAIGPVKSGGKPEPKPQPAIINRIGMPPPRTPESLRPPFEAKKLQSPTYETPSLGDLTTRRARMVKSTSVPAILSSSLAQPTLSSTASLVKPALEKPRLHMKSLPTVTESVTPPEPKSVTKSPPGDLAFGQARLRDLIKKYQGPKS